EQPPQPDSDKEQPDEVGEVFTLLRRVKALVKAFPADVSLETIERLIKAWEIVRAAIYRLREPEKGEPMTDDSICPFGKHKGEPLRNVPDSYLRWWIKQNPDRNAIESKAATFDYRERAVALRGLKLWDYIAARFRPGINKGNISHLDPQSA